MFAVSNHNQISNKIYKKLNIYLNKSINRIKRGKGRKISEILLFMNLNLYLLISKKGKIFETILFQMLIIGTYFINLLVNLNTNNAITTKHKTTFLGQNPYRLTLNSSID